MPDLATTSSSPTCGNNNVGGNANMMSLSSLSSIAHNQDNSNASAGSHQSDEHILASPQDHVSVLEFFKWSLPTNVIFLWGTNLL